MKKINIDIYKIILLTLASLFLYFYMDNSKIGRFVPITNNGVVSILDTKNGAIYVLNNTVSPPNLYTKPILK